MTVFSFATQTLGIILSKLCSSYLAETVFLQCRFDGIGNSSPQNGSIIWLSTSGDTVTEVFCQFIRETTAGRGIVGWFVNGEEITYHREQFHGVQFSANDPNRQATSTLTVKIVATEKEEILYLNDGSITCYPPGNYGGTVFGLFRTFVAGYGQFAELHTRCDCVLITLCAPADFFASKVDTLYMEYSLRGQKLHMALNYVFMLCLNAGMPTNNTDIDMPTISNTSNDTADVPTVFPTGKLFYHTPGVDII